jgi:hypothetical protein
VPNTQKALAGLIRHLLAVLGGSSWYFGGYSNNAVALIPVTAR